MTKKYWCFTCIVGFVVAGAGLAVATADGPPRPKVAPWTDSDGALRIDNFQPPTSVAPLVSAVRRTVVNIYTTQKNAIPRLRWNTPPGFEDFLRPFDKGFEPEFERDSLGTGFLLSADGMVVTNHHVVANSNDIRVRTHNGEEFEAKVVGVDAKSDLALLKIDSASTFPYVVLGDSDAVSAGDWVLAIGQPLGLQETVTLGIVSGKGRVIGAGPYDDFIQTDASINPGNSGGPLFNMRGEVVGINTAIVRGAPGIGFAIPVNLARDVIRQLVNDGYVSRGWLGVQIQPVDEGIAKAFRVGKARGAIITQVFPSSPAEKVGLKVGDIIVRVGSKPIHLVTDLTKAVASVRPGTAMEIEYIRGGEKNKIVVQAAQRKDDQVAEEASQDKKFEEMQDPGISPSRILGLRLADGNRGEGTAGGGVWVESVTPGSSAGIADIRVGDRILEVNGIVVQSAKDVDQQIDAAPKDESLLLLLERQSGRFFVTVSPLAAR